ncbi:MAG: hypothetical protein LWX11_05250 [Firmicutes bacterium]|nr:hypothetical protein [Bacillota bacterium]
MKSVDPGSEHLVWIGRFMWGLWPLGSLAWLVRSRQAALAFAVGGLGSLAFWYLHRWVVARMLTPSVRRRWFFGILGLAKLALIVLLLRGMMTMLPDEGLSLATGLLLFAGAILLEALRLILSSFHDAT